MTMNDEQFWHLSDDDLARIKRAIYHELYDAESGRYSVEVELPLNRTIFIDLDYEVSGHVEDGAYFMGEWEEIGVTDSVDVTIEIAVVCWDETDGDGQDHDVTDQVREYEDDLCGMLL